MRKTKAAGLTVKVNVDIKPGQSSLAQKATWRKFWQKLMAEVKISER